MRNSLILTTLLRNRFLASVILGAGVLQLLLSALHLPSWPCPLLAATGLPCPGCGLTRASLAVLSGHIEEGLTIHLFALLMPPALLLLCTAWLPFRIKEKYLARIESLERRTGMGTIILTGLVVYWFVRLVFFRDALLRLVNG